MVPLDQKKYLTIGEVAELISTTPSQIRKWEREGLMPEPAVRKKVGKRLDRRYTWDQIPVMRSLRYEYRVGAPTAEEAEKRSKIQESLKPKPTPSCEVGTSSSPETGS